MPTRWRTFATEPLSSTKTSSPRDRKASARCDPPNPPPPVIRIFMFSRTVEGSCSDQGIADADTVLARPPRGITFVVAGGLNAQRPQCPAASLDDEAIVDLQN